MSIKATYVKLESVRLSFPALMTDVLTVYRQTDILCMPVLAMHSDLVFLANFSSRQVCFTGKFLVSGSLALGVFFIRKLLLCRQEQSALQSSQCTHAATRTYSFLESLLHFGSFTSWRVQFPFKPCLHQFACCAGSSKVHFRAVSAPMQRHTHCLKTAAQQPDIPVQPAASRQAASQNHSAPSSSSSSTSASDYGQCLGRSSSSSTSASHDQQSLGHSSSSIRHKDAGCGSSMAPCLFAFPAESNFSGARYDPAVVNQIQTNGLTVSSSIDSAFDSKAAVMHQTHSQSSKQCEEEQREQNSRPAVTRNGEEEQIVASSRPIRGSEEEDEQSTLLGSRGKEEGQDSRWHVLVDAAKACASSPPHLTQHPADFVVSNSCQPWTLLTHASSLKMAQ